MIGSRCLPGDWRRPRAKATKESKASKARFSRPGDRWLGASAIESIWGLGACRVSRRRFSLHGRVCSGAVLSLTSCTGSLRRTVRTYYPLYSSRATVVHGSTVKAPGRFARRRSSNHWPLAGPPWTEPVGVVVATRRATAPTARPRRPGHLGPRSLSYLRQKESRGPCSSPRDSFHRTVRASLSTSASIYRRARTRPLRPCGWWKR
jgi:hypothetical protein